MTWTDERTEKCRALWQRGLPASQIADILGNVSRNAVIGKVHRLGLTGRADRKDAGNLSRRRARPRKQALMPRPAQPKPVKRIRSAITGMPSGIPWEPAEMPSPTAFDDERRASGLVHLLDLEPHQCRYSIAYDDRLGHGFCGCQSVSGLPYCEHHAARVYTSAYLADLRPLRTFAGVSTVILGETHAHANVAEFLEPA
jgi:GcrA cell cycle regulator